MTIKQASELICPFILQPKILYDDGILPTTLVTNSYCITDKCMAWETIETRELNIDDVDEHGVVRNLPREDCEGYCRRLR